jgi:hypothetical protein
MSSSMKIATGRIVKGAIVTRARFPEGAHVRIVREDQRPPVELDPDEEAGMLKGLQEFDEGKGRPASRLRAKLRRHYR